MGRYKVITVDDAGHLIERWETDAEWETRERSKALAEEIKAKSNAQGQLLHQMFHGTNPCADVPLETDLNKEDTLRRAYGIPIEGRLKECECGAAHTSFPDSHLSFCPMND